LEVITDERLIEALARTPIDAYAIWTGESCGAQAGSLRSRALACIHEQGEPVPLRAFLQRAARLDGRIGLNPDAVRNSLRQHQMAQPAAYLLVRRQACGTFVAEVNIPFPAGQNRPFAAGEEVMDRDGRWTRRPAVPEERQGGRILRVG
jgi:hypothetical protein